MLVFEATWAPGGSPPPAHFHPSQSEHFERARWETRPAGRTEEWFRALSSLQGTEWVDDRGLPEPLAFAALANGYQDTFRLAGSPQPVTRIALAAAAALARLRGFRQPS